MTKQNRSHDFLRDGQRLPSELTEIMRQRDDKQFAKLLNCLREGSHPENDIQCSRFETKTSPP